MTKIFFGCSMRGGYANASREELVKLRNSIEELGLELVSRHQLKEGIFEEENKLASEEIHDRDYNWLREADAGIFEISNPSLGTGPFSKLAQERQYPSVLFALHSVFAIKHPELLQ